MVTNNAINLSSPGITVYNGTGTFFGRTLTAGTGISITNGDGTAGNPVISASGTVAQVFAGNAGTAAPSSGTLTISGVGAISTSGSGSTISISAAAATTASLGVASFVSTNFLVTSGVVSLIGSVPLSFVENGPTTATPSGNALSVLGSGGIVTSGAGSTITISASGTVAQSFIENGPSTATPAAGILSVLGTFPISTAGAGSTITISSAAATTASLGVASFVSTNFLVTSGVVSLIGSVPLSFVENGPTTATPSGNALSVLGSGGIVTSGAGSTITISASGTVAQSFIENGPSTATPAAGILSVLGTFPISTAGAGSTITISSAAATTASLGVASFVSTNFLVTSGVVSLIGSVPLAFIENGPTTATPSGNALSVLGSGGIVTSGAGSTITISASGTVAQSFIENGPSTATPAAGILSVLGTFPISTAGAGSTITISSAAATTASLGVASFVSTNFLVTSGVVSLIGSVPLAFIENGPTTATPSGNALSVLGSGGIVTSGAGSTITISASGTVAQSFIENGPSTATPAAGILSVLGTFPISTAGAGSTITISSAAATTASLGVASFVSTNFLVTSGVVSLIGSVPLAFIENGPTTATPSGNALSVLGSGGIVTSGAGSTITISASGTVAQSFIENGPSTATPAAGILSVLGTFPISTAGAGSTITISSAAATTASLGVASFVSTNFLVTSGVVSLIGSVPLAFIENGPTTATPSGNVISIVGGAGIVTSGSASTITISSTGGGLTWQTITSSVTAAANNGYIVTGGTVTITLPATIALGQVVDVLLDGGTAWVVKAPTTGTIVLGNALATTSILSGTNSVGDFVSLLAQTSTRWDAISVIGNIGYS